MARYPLQAACVCGFCFGEWNRLGRRDGAPLLYHRVRLREVPDTLFMLDS
jgi:hypothetical protein